MQRSDPGMCEGTSHEVRLVSPLPGERNCRVIQASFTGVGRAFTMTNQPDRLHQLETRMGSNIPFF